MFDLEFLPKMWIFDEVAVAYMRTENKFRVIGFAWCNMKASNSNRILHPLRNDAKEERKNNFLCVVRGIIHCQTNQISSCLIQFRMCSCAPDPDTFQTFFEQRVEFRRNRRKCIDNIERIVVHCIFHSFTAFRVGSHLLLFVLVHFWHNDGDDDHTTLPMHITLQEERV